MPPVDPTRRADQYLDRLMARHGSAESALRAISAELFAAQDAVTTLTAQVADYRTKLPDGAIVLTKEAAQNWTKLQDLKLTPEQLEAAVKERDTLKGETATHKLERLAREAATVAGLDPDALTDHAKVKGLAIEMRDATIVEHGKSVTKKIPHVRPAADERGAWKPLSEYSTSLPAHEQRALKATATTPAPIGTPFIEQQPPPAGGQPGDRTADFIAKRNQQAASRPNPFAPPRQPTAAPQ